MVGHRPTPEFPAHLEALYRQFPFERSLAHDPLALIRPFAHHRRSAEVAAVFAATLAIGNTTAIRGSLRALFERWDDDPAGFVERPVADRRRRLRGFHHRWIRDDQLLQLSDTLAGLYASGQDLEGIFSEGQAEGRAFAGGLDAVARALRDGADRTLPRGYAHLFPSPLDRSRSACKRLTLMVRWLVRPGYPDLGTWSRVRPADLRIPLDQHVYWIAYHLGLTRRKTRDWRTVEEVTAALRAIDPDDPVKYDFVLCHTGISGDCPKERDLAVCGPCVVRPDCLLWRRARAPVAAA